MDRAADDFAIISKRLAELQRERGIAEPEYQDYIEAVTEEINAEFNMHGERIGQCEICRNTWSPCIGSCF
jgi:hypothetical protein